MRYLAILCLLLTACGAATTEDEGWSLSDFERPAPVPGPSEPEPNPCPELAMWLDGQVVWIPVACNPDACIGGNCVTLRVRINEYGYPEPYYVPEMGTEPKREGR